MNNSMNKIRTRFAPSPTGYLHIGNIRTALYSWLYSRHYKGKFILRIEDTDVERTQQEAIEAIINGMNWLNLTWDEGPYYQTDRFKRYHEVINEMLDKGTAYRCYCSKDRLSKLHEEQIIKGEKQRYDGYCRDNVVNKTKYNYSTSDKPKPYVIRFRNPQEGSVSFCDLIRGPIKYNNIELDDLIICRANGVPTYNFCVVIDDWDMKITHVIRGVDQINNTPRQINIIKAIGASIPEYAHLSIVLDYDNQKLSKRHSAINIMQYRNEGYLPEALLNYLVRLGWSHGNQEIFSLDEMIKYFSLAAITKSTSTFNPEKLLWLNHYYINALPAEYVATHLAWQVEQQGIDIKNGPSLVSLVKLFGKRCKTLKEIAISCYYLYNTSTLLDTDDARKFLRPSAYLPLATIKQKLSIVNNWTCENIIKAIESTAIELKMDMSEISMLLRVAVTGTSKSPGIAITVYTINKYSSLKRIDNALSYIDNSEK